MRLVAVAQMAKNRIDRWPRVISSWFTTPIEASTQPCSFFEVSYGNASTPTALDFIVWSVCLFGSHGSLIASEHLGAARIADLPLNKRAPLGHPLVS